MNKLRLIDAKNALAPIAGQTGMQVTDSRLTARINTAVRELIDEGDWPGVLDRYHFRVYGGVITLPADLNRISGVAINGRAREIASPWYEFVASGPGSQEDGMGWTDVMIDRGEVCTFQPIPAEEPSFVEVNADLDERASGVRPRIILQGYDENGTWIRSMIGGVPSDGIEVEINGDTSPKSSLSSVKFSIIEAVIKPVTLGYVRLAVTVDDVKHVLSSYAPDEKLPSFRQYFVPALDPDKTSTVLVRARKRFVAASRDNDFLIITNLPALENMMVALQKRAEEDYSGYASAKSVAVDLLTKEAKAYRGASVRKPAIAFTEGGSIGAMLYVR